MKNPLEEGDDPLEEGDDIYMTHDEGMKNNTTDASKKTRNRITERSDIEQEIRDQDILGYQDGQDF